MVAETEVNESLLQKKLVKLQQMKLKQYSEYLFNVAAAEAQKKFVKLKQSNQS